MVAAVVGVLGGNEAEARSRGSYGSYGSYGSHGSYGSYASYGSYGSSGGYAAYSTYYGSSGSSGSYASTASYGSSGSAASSGSHGGLFARWHARKAARQAARASHGSSGSSASSGSYGSSGSSASSGSYGSSGSSASSGSYGSAGSYSYGYSVESGAPVEYESEMPATDSETSPTPADAGATLDDAGATIHVTLPALAKVFVNDAPTTSTGADRRFVSRGLRRGLTYSYRIRVEYEADGEPKVENRIVRLTAGGSVDLMFGSDAEQVADAEQATTELTLNVPEQAKVFLSGSATSQSGAVRTYSTTQLQDGEQWSDYVVRVELEQNGEKMVEERSLTLQGGQSYELSIDFGDQRVALLD